jgi:hypothetical protein
MERRHLLTHLPKLPAKALARGDVSGPVKGPVRGSIRGCGHQPKVLLGPVGHISIGVLDHVTGGDGSLMHKLPSNVRMSDHLTFTFDAE